MAVKCPKCGADVVEGKRFCSLCGTAIAAADPPSPPAMDVREETPAAPDNGGGAPPPPVAANETGAPTAGDEAPASKPGAALPRYWEPDPDSGFKPSSSPSEAPEFKIWSMGYDDPAADGAFEDGEESLSRSIFYRKPWLVNAICYGFIAFIAIVIIVSSIRHKTASQKTFSSPSVIITQPNPIEAATLDCRIRMKKSLGSVRVQPRKGTNFFQIKTGQCMPPGSQVYTDKKSRALFESVADKTRVHVNSETDVQIGSDAGDAATGGNGFEVSLRAGEIYVVSDAGGETGLNLPLGKARAAGPGKFHLMAGGGIGYFTCVEGLLSVTVSKGGRTLSPGAQLKTAVGTDVVAVKEVPLDEFMLWVGEWKDDFSPPKKQVAVVKAQAAQKTDERKTILEAAGRGIEEKIPAYAQMDILAVAGDWAVVIVKDSRPDAAELPDFYPQRANLLKKISGHWAWIEGFDDYSEELFNAWAGKWGFDKKAEAALKLAY